MTIDLEYKVAVVVAKKGRKQTKNAVYSRNGLIFKTNQVSKQLE